MRPLYEIVKYKEELEALAESDDIPAETIANTLEAIEGELEEKAVNVAAFTRNLDASAKAIREAAAGMLERAERLERRAESIRAYLLFNMQAAGISKIECPFFKIAVRKNPPAVMIDNSEILPERFLVQPPTPPPRPDKIAIRDALKAGEPVPGAHLMQTERVEIKE